METVRRMYEHLHWANDRLLTGLHTNPQPEALKLFTHILQSEKVWWTRLQGEDSTALPIWPEPGLEVCEALAAQNKRDFTGYWDRLTEREFREAEITYRNQTGRQYTTAVRDVLTHVALHGQYHRGQINTLLRQTGGEPVNVDFITYVRQQ